MYFTISYFSLTACSDPGIVFVPLVRDESSKLELVESANNSQSTYTCGLCNVERPRNAYHCMDCGICVVELDHHCPVSNQRAYKR